MDELVPGKTYFIVLFHDEDLKVPIVQTLIYDREGRRGNGIECYLFRDVSSHQQEPRFYVDKKDATHLLVDQDGLLDKLRRCFEGKLATGPR